LALAGLLPGKFVSRGRAFRTGFLPVRKGIDIPVDARCAACRPRLTTAQGPRVEQRAGGGKARRVAGTDAGQFGVSTGCAVDKPRNPAANLAGTMPARRVSGVAFLFGYFLFGHAKRK
jgi:hypothetical protein